MKWWMRERDQLIEQTLAFVEGVSAARPVRAEPSPKPEPAKAVEPARPAALASMASERAEIERRVANFKAHQQKFQREREAHYNAVFSKTRATPGNPTRA
jgi:chorismate mutase